jgi:glucan phosphoethanolaminetransferase (alkaline phosphatase superfamily)
MLNPGNTLFRLKLAAHSVFGFLILLDSLFLILCYVTFDFYGALASPFFAWLRRDAFLAHVLYFPTFAAALLGADAGLDGKRKQWVVRAAGAFLLLQLSLGFLLYILPGIKEFFGWAMLFGPNIRMPSGEIATYCESIACLIPLAWISIIHIATCFRAVNWKKPGNTLSLGAFIAAGVAAPVLYQLAARSREAVAGQAFSFVALGFSIAAHLLIFLGIFVLLQWIRVIAFRFRNPGLAEFALRCLAVWGLLAIVMRKIVFSLLAFNNGLADWYASVFSLVLVLFVVALVLKIRHQRADTGKEQSNSPRFHSWLSRSLALAAILVFFFLCAFKLAPIDWAHILGSLTALAMWALLIWFFIALRRRERTYAPWLLSVLTVVVFAGLAGMRIAIAKPSLGDSLEQYAAYDASLFVVQNSFKPAMEDDKYGAWYDFLTEHAAIRVPVTAPEVALTPELKPSKIEKPNIFFFVIDALRRDYVSAYNPAVTFTPHFGEFAKDCVVFENAYSPYAGTALADPALFAGFQQLNKIFPKPLARENNLQPMLNLDGYDSYVSFNSIVGAMSADFPGITPLDTDRSDQLDFGPIVQELEGDILNRKDPWRPIFAFAQPTNVHTLFLAWHGGKVEVKPHPGFNDEYASAVERVDKTFGDFIAFLKQQGLYENSVIIVTADHGESLGEMGRVSHVSNVTPEVIRIPLIIHLPGRLKSQMVWNAEDVVMLHDLTPTLYYLLGHRPINNDPMVGRPLFTLTQAEQKRSTPDHYFLMSSYGAVFGILSADQQNLFFVDATLHRNFYYDLKADPHALRNKVTVQIRDHYEPLIRRDLEKIDSFYGLSEQQLAR